VFIIAITGGEIMAFSENKTYNFSRISKAKAYAKKHPVETFFAKHFGERYYFGEEQEAGWKAPIAFYFFYHKKCLHFSVDIQHGPTSDYITCQYCNDNLDALSVRKQIVSLIKSLPKFLGEVWRLKKELQKKD